MWTPVQPLRTPPQLAVNFLASAQRPDDEGGGTWQDGIAWRSESCPNYRLFDPCAELEGPPPASDDTIVYAKPVAYQVGWQCTTMSGERDLEDAARVADAIASFVLARELWTGAATKGKPYTSPAGDDQVNPHLASSSATTVTVASATSVAAVLAVLEGEAREVSKQTPYLHVPIHLLNRLGGNVLRRVGNELRTQTDAVVIGDGGYPGTGPDGTGDGWIYATGPVAARLGPIDAPAVAIDHRTNTRYGQASRMFLTTFDPCLHLAMQVTT